MAKKETVDLNTSEAKELLKNYVQSIQRIDDNISKLREERNDILTVAKDNGFKKTFINGAISRIRQEMKKDELEKTEQEFYEDLIKEFNIVGVV